MTTACSVGDCDASTYSRGYCTRHYQRWRKHGDPLTVGRSFGDRTKNRACSVEGCGEKHKARGYCHMHWKRWRRHGDPLTVATAPGSRQRTDEEVWAVLLDRRRIDERTECWLYTGGRDESGYGYISLRGRDTGAHRASYIIRRGDVPADLEVCHRCDNPPCFNPDHLFLGTHAENVADMAAKKRGRKPRKLTSADVEAIRVSDERGVDLARRYGISQQYVSDIRRRSR
jgi:hypothetical protein